MSISKGSIDPSSSVDRPVLQKSNDSAAFTFSPYPTERFIRVGRGGAGNFRSRTQILATRSTPRSQSTSILLSRRRSSASTKRSYSIFGTGIGGRGNFRHIEQKATLTDAELEKRTKTASMSVPERFRAGIGGFGNAVKRQRVGVAPEGGKKKLKSLKQMFQRSSQVSTAA